jgi:hypothetical protein
VCHEKATAYVTSLFVPDSFSRSDRAFLHVQG